MSCVFHFVAYCSMILVYILIFMAGIAIGYVVFYFKYENRELVVELRNTIKKLSTELAELSIDYEEYKEQNVLFREKLSELYAKNDDLVGVVSELSRYYYHIKKWSEKVQELAKFLKLPDDTIEHKVQQYSSVYTSQEEENDEIDQKSFF